MLTDTALNQKPCACPVKKTQAVGIRLERLFAQSYLAV